jgi:hypothetical protein
MFDPTTFLNDEPVQVKHFDYTSRPFYVGYGDPTTFQTFFNTGSTFWDFATVNSNQGGVMSPQLLNPEFGYSENNRVGTQIYAKHIEFNVYWKTASIISTLLTSSTITTAGTVTNNAVPTGNTIASTSTFNPNFTLGTVMRQALVRTMLVLDTQCSADDYYGQFFFSSTTPGAGLPIIKPLISDVLSTPQFIPSPNPPLTGPFPSSFLRHDNSMRFKVLFDSTDTLSPYGKQSVLNLNVELDLDFVCQYRNTILQNNRCQHNALFFIFLSDSIGLTNRPLCHFSSRVYFEDP